MGAPFSGMLPSMEGATSIAATTTTGGVSPSTTSTSSVADSLGDLFGGGSAGGTTSTMGGGGSGDLLSGMMGSGARRSPTTPSPPPPPATVASQLRSKSNSRPLVPANLPSTAAYGKLWTSQSFANEQMVNVRTSKESSADIASVFSSSCGLQVVSEVQRTGEVIAAGKLRTNGAVCLVHAKAVPGKGVTLKIRSGDPAFSKKTGRFLYSALK